MRKVLPGIAHWKNEYDKRATTLEVNLTKKVLVSIKGVSYRRIEETETKGIYHLKFEVRGFGFFYLMYADCDEDFAKEAKKNWLGILKYVTNNPPQQWRDISFDPSNPLIKTVISDLSRSKLLKEKYNAKKKNLT